MSIRPHLRREAAMLEMCEARLLKSGEFLTPKAFALLAQLCMDQSSVELMEWKRAENIFSMTHEGNKYFPVYAFDHASGYRPFLLGSHNHDPSAPASMTGLWRSDSAFPVATWEVGCRMMY